MRTCGTPFSRRRSSAPGAGRSVGSMSRSRIGLRGSAPRIIRADREEDAALHWSTAPHILFLSLAVCIFFASASADLAPLSVVGWPEHLPALAVLGLFGRDKPLLFGRFRRTGRSSETGEDVSDAGQAPGDAAPADPAPPEAGDSAPLLVPSAADPISSDLPGAGGVQEESVSQLIERLESIPVIFEHYSRFSELDEVEFRNRLKESGITLSEDAADSADGADIVLEDTDEELPFGIEDAAISDEEAAPVAWEDPDAEPLPGPVDGAVDTPARDGGTPFAAGAAEDDVSVPDPAEWPGDFEVFFEPDEDFCLPGPDDDTETADEPKDDAPAYADLPTDDLIAGLGSDDAAVRQEATAVLGARGAAVIEPLVDALGSPNDQIRWSAADALRIIGEEAIPSLIGSLKDSRRQLGAATALVKVGEVAAPHLINALGDEDGDIRIGAAYALEEIGAPAIPFLVRSLMRPEDEIRRGVATILGDLGWTPGNDDDRVRFLIAGERWVDIAEIGAPAVGPLLDLLASSDPLLQRSAARTLGAMGEIAVEQLVAVFDDENPRTRRLAALALADIGTPAVGALIDLLRRPEVRDEAATALVRIGDAAVLPLISAQKGADDASAAILQGILAGIGEPAEAPLIHVLLTGDVAEMRAAAQVLEAMGWEPWNDDERVCYLIARGQWDEAAGMGPPAAGPLTRALSSDDAAVRRDAAAGLGRLADPGSVLPLVRALNDDAACTEAAEALVGIGEPAVGPLLPVLEQSGEAGRRLAAEILGRIGSAAAVDPLVRALYVDDDRLRRKTIDALSAIGEPAVEPLIVLLAADDDLQLAAIRALAGIGDAALVPLRAALGARNIRTRAGAAEALDRLGWTPEDAGDEVRYLIARERWSDAAGLGEPAAAPLIAAFCGPDADVSAGAAEALARMGSAGVPSLVLLLGDARHRKPAADLLVRIGTSAIDPLVALLVEGPLCPVAAEILVRIGDAAVPALITCLTDPGRAAGAARTLTAMGTAAVDPLIAVLGDGRDGLRRRAGDVLLAIGSDAYQPLIAALSDSEEEIRLGAAAVLTRAGTDAAEPLIFALQDGDFRVRLGAAEVLGRIGWKPEGEAETIRYLLAKEQWTELARMGAPAVEPLILALGDPDADIQMGAALALGMIGKPAVSPLILTLRDENTAESEKAIVALKKIGDPAIHALVQAFRDDDWHIRLGAARALVRIGSPAVDSLIQALHAGSPAVMMGAAAALGKIGDPRAIEPLVVVLLQEDWDIGRIAVHALGMMGADAVEPLTRVLEKGSETAWKGAVESLVMIGEPARPLFVALLADENYRVRAGAAEALDRLGWRPTGEEELAHYLIAKEQWVDLAHLGPVAVEPLIRVLRDGDDSIRRRAAGVLGETRDGRAAVPLVRLLCDDYHSIRREAAAALVKIGEPSVAPLAAALSSGDEDVRRRAVGALGEIGGGAAARALAACLDDSSWHVQKAARDALEQIRR